MSGSDVRGGGEGHGKGGNTHFSRSVRLCPSRVALAPESGIKGGVL